MIPILLAVLLTVCAVAAYRHADAGPNDDIGAAIMFWLLAVLAAIAWVALIVIFIARHISWT